VKKLPVIDANKITYGVGEVALFFYQAGKYLSIYA
jgi:hypothetical protein